MKIKFAAVSVLLSLSITGCVSPQAEAFKANTTINKYPLTSQVKESVLSMKIVVLKSNRTIIDSALNKLRTHVGKTWYVFSGATPAGWDCSGLVMWTYKQMGISLEHRASKQAKAGFKVSSPKPGDIVVFRYKGSSDAYHVGIYYKDGLMIHAPKHGHATRIENIAKFSGKYTNYSFVRILNSI
jgi:cell wall-associated NlpC family hydrolase